MPISIFRIIQEKDPPLQIIPYVPPKRATGFNGSSVTILGKITLSITVNAKCTHKNGIIMEFDKTTEYEFDIDERESNKTFVGLASLSNYLQTKPVTGVFRDIWEQEDNMATPLVRVNNLTQIKSLIPVPRSGADKD